MHVVDRSVMTGEAGFVWDNRAEARATHMAQIAILAENSMGGGHWAAAIDDPVAGRPFREQPSYCQDRKGYGEHEPPPPESMQAGEILHIDALSERFGCSDPWHRLVPQCYYSMDCAQKKQGIGSGYVHEKPAVQHSMQCPLPIQLAFLLANALKVV